jgi:hypothetical protein
VAISVLTAPSAASRWPPSCTAPSAEARRSRHGSARAARYCLALGIAAALLQAAPAASPASAGTDAIPDLAVAPLTDFQIQRVGGQRLLRFSATMVNSGAGNFELHGSRGSASESMSISQIIYPDGRAIATPGSAHFAGDGHNHWHIAEMMRYDVWGPGGTQRGTMVGFCFLDTDRMPGTTSDPAYTGCGTNPNALSIQMGISVGWGDKYDWSIAQQWVDVTGLPLTRALALPPTGADLFTRRRGVG